MSSRKIIVLAATFVLALINLHVPCIGQVLLDPLTQPKFVNPLPIPTRINLQTGGTYAVAMSQFNQNMGLVDPVLGTSLTTTIWGYNGTYIVARMNRERRATNRTTALSHPVTRGPRDDASVLCGGAIGELWEQG